jgi:sec-independent protein translocase protein TatB
MFGIGFTEILLISIIAILFLGPDKLPEALIQIAKFIKGVKKTVGEAKSSLDEELRIADLKEEALNYKKQLDTASSELQGFKNIDLDDMSDLLEQEKGSSPTKALPSKESEPEKPLEAKKDTVTFKKASGQEQHHEGATTETPQENSAQNDTKGEL